MTVTTAPRPLARNRDQLERRWFYGGGIHVMHARAAETGGAFFLSETEMEQGKVTPLHTHPADESLYVLEGELLVHIDGEEFTIGTGGFTIAPAGVPHAFKVVSAGARVLDFQTPGTCEAFYLGASEPTGTRPDDGHRRLRQDHRVRPDQRRVRTGGTAAVLSPT